MLNLNCDQPYLFYVNSQDFWTLMLACTLFSPIYWEIENYDFECYSRLVFQFFPWWKRWKTGVFWIRLVRDSLVDQSMMFTHLYFMLGEKIEAWFLSPASREYFGVESTAFLSASKFSKKIYPLVRWTAKYVFFHKWNYENSC